MNFKDWYTDTVDIYRVVPVQEGNLTRQQRQLITKGVPCRIYRTGNSAPTMEQTAAYIREESNLSCDNAVDLRAGDELHLHRGALLGHTVQTTRAFAGDPHHYYEPFGAVIPGLAHQEIRLLQEERIDSVDVGTAGEAAETDSTANSGEA